MTGNRGEGTADQGLGSGSRAWVRRTLGPLAAAFLAAAAIAGQAGAAHASETTVKVIVSSSTTGGASSGVAAVGGKVDDSLDAAGAVVADVTPSQLAALNADGSVQVTPNSTVVMMGAPAPAPNAPTRSPAAVFPQVTGADQLVAHGITGSGVNVALVDTGVDSLPDFSGRLVDGTDLSGEGNPFQDSYGHGTFVAGLIAGNGASSSGAYRGEAPSAGLVSVKVAGASGVTDVATVVKGIDWVIAHRQHDNIRVLNLSLGAVPAQSIALDPLDRAVEQAWRDGIVVVASAGNAGPSNGTITSPGNDPLVVTVGTLDDNGTVTPADDSIPSFSSVGPTMQGVFKPDLVAPGRSVISLRAPGSTVDSQYPSARIGDYNFVGSGSSFSTAVTSGAVALMLQARPELRPDEVKGRLLITATPGPTGNPFVDGHGTLNALFATIASGHIDLEQSARVPRAGSNGSVSLAEMWTLSSWNADNWSRPSFGGASWNGASWNGASWNGASWNGASWNGASWNGASWNGASWNGASWNGASWNGASWNGASWNGASWNGASWNGASWNGASWNGASWNGASWNGASWNGASWNGASWNGASWNGASWNGASWNGASWNGASWNGASWNGASWNGASWNGAS